MEIKKIRYILHSFFDKSENVSQTAEIMNWVYGLDTITAILVLLIPFRDASHTDRSVMENVNKIREIFKADQHASSRSIVQGTKIDPLRALKHLHKTGLKKKLIFGCHIKIYDGSIFQL